MSINQSHHRSLIAFSRPGESVRARAGVDQLLDFEVDLAEACKSYKLKKIVEVLDHGDIPADIPLLGRIGIPFIVFERDGRLWGVNHVS